MDLNIQYDDPYLYQNDTPLVFTDGTKVFELIASEYTRHKKGFYILGPSGVGKTHYISNQKKKDWIDGDILWQLSHAHPRGKWWELPIPECIKIDSRADVITQEAIKYGFRIIGASSTWLLPDAIVVPDWKKHKEWILQREKGEYDGGATSKDFKQVQGHRKWILEYVEKGVPRFETVQAAVEYLESQKSAA